MSRQDPQLKVRVTEEMKEMLTEAARKSGRSVNAEIVLRLEQSFAAKAPANADDSVKALKSLAATLDARAAKHVIDVGHAIATTREVIKLLKDLAASPEHKAQAVVVGKRTVESAATYLGRPYGYIQMLTSRFVEEDPPADPLEEVIAVAEWVCEMLVHDYRRLRSGENVSP